MAFQPEDLAVLRRLRDLQPDRSRNRRHVGFAAEHRGGDRQRHARAQVLAVALEDGVRPQVDAQVEIARGAAVGARFALAGGADARPVPDADRDPDVDAARVAPLLDRDPAGRAVERFLQRQLDVVLDVASLLRARRPRLPPAPARLARAAGAAEEGAEEVRERILVAEEVVHLFFGHRPVAARTTHVDRPGAALAGPRAARPRLTLLLGLLVH